MSSNHRSRLPTMKEAVDIVTMQISRREQIRQLQFMEQTQGRDFAEKVRDKVKSAGGFKA